jgi:hypothetical protein
MNAFGQCVCRRKKIQKDLPALVRLHFVETIYYEKKALDPRSAARAQGRFQEFGEASGLILWPRPVRWKDFTHHLRKARRLRFRPAAGFRLDCAL